MDTLKTIRLPCSVTSTTTVFEISLLLYQVVLKRFEAKTRFVNSPEYSF